MFIGRQFVGVHGLESVLVENDEGVRREGGDFWLIAGS